MKKSVFTLLAIAFAVITMSSCSKDDGGSSNDLNIPEKKTEDASTYQYRYKAALSNDVLDLFDVTIVRTVAGKSTTYDLNKSATYKDEDGREHSFKAMDEDIFTASKSDKVSIKATLTPKANWQSILDAKTGDINLYYIYSVTFNYGGKISYHNPDFAPGSPFEKSKITKETLDWFASAVSIVLSYSNE